MGLSTANLNWLPVYGLAKITFIMTQAIRVNPIFQLWFSPFRDFGLTSIFCVIFF